MRFVAGYYGERIMKMVDEVMGNSVVVSLVLIDSQTVSSGLLLAMLHIIKINFVNTLWRNCFLFKSRIKLHHKVNFANSFTIMLSNKSEINLPLNIHRHLKSVATLSCWLVY